MFENFKILFYNYISFHKKTSIIDTQKTLHDCLVKKDVLIYMDIGQQYTTYTKKYRCNNMFLKPEEICIKKIIGDRCISYKDRENKEIEIKHNIEKLDIHDLLFINKKISSIFHDTLTKYKKDKILYGYNYELELEEIIKNIDENTTKIENDFGVITYLEYYTYKKFNGNEYIINIDMYKKFIKEVEENELVKKYNDYENNSSAYYNDKYDLLINTVDEIAEKYNISPEDFYC